jgi:hypothetical protein
MGGLRWKKEAEVHRRVSPVSLEEAVKGGILQAAAGQGEENNADGGFLR